MCRSFRAEARKVFSDMADAAMLGISRDEETITQDLLLSLAKKHRGGGLDIKTFTKSEERANGADWAFWFAGYKGLGIGVRIQAKRLFEKEVRYKSLYHQSEKQRKESKVSGLLTPNQCETLLNHRDGMIPMYAFYNSYAIYKSGLFRHYFRANSFPLRDKYWNGDWSIEDWGISVGAAIAVKNANWGKNNHPGEFPMIPLHCLFCTCCWDEHPVDTSLPFLIGYGLQKMYSISASGVDETDDVKRDLDFSFEPTEDAPRWVGLMREGISSEIGLEEEMSRLQLKGVAVIGEVPE